MFSNFLELTFTLPQSILCNVLDTYERLKLTLRPDIPYANATPVLWQSSIFSRRCSSVVELACRLVSPLLRFCSCNNDSSRRRMSVIRRYVQILVA